MILTNTSRIANSVIPTLILNNPISSKKNSTPKEQILALLHTQGITSETEVLTALSPPNVPKTERLAAITIKRAIKELAETGEIIKLRNDKLRECGIIQKDKRVVYLALKKSEREQRLTTKLLNTLGSKDKTERLIALRELRDKAHFQLMPQHLALFITLLHEEKNWESDECNFSLEVLKNHIQRGILPPQQHGYTLTADIEQQIKKSKINDNLFEKLLEILGFLHDKRIVNIIDYLAGNNLLLQYKEKLHKWQVSGAITDNDEEIMDLQLKYKKQTEIEQVIYEIRKRASEQYLSYKNSLEAARLSLLLPRP